MVSVERVNEAEARGGVPALTLTPYSLVFAPVGVLAREPLRLLLGRCDCTSSPAADLAETEVWVDLKLGLRLGEGCLRTAGVLLPPGLGVTGPIPIGLVAKGDFEPKAFGSATGPLASSPIEKASSPVIPAASPRENVMVRSDMRREPRRSNSRSPDCSSSPSCCS